MDTADVPCDATISIQINRADGTVEDVGIVAARFDLTPGRQRWWDMIGRRWADNRIRSANAAHRPSDVE